MSATGLPCGGFQDQSFTFQEISSGSEAICHFHARAIARRRKAWFHLRMSRLVFAAKQLNDIAHEHTIICRQLFAGHVVGSRPMKRKKHLHRMIISFIPFLTSNYNAFLAL